MARHTFPEDRLAFFTTGPGEPIRQAGQTEFWVYLDEALTTLASITTTSDVNIPGSMLIIGSDGLIPDFKGPEGVTTLWLKFVEQDTPWRVSTQGSGGGGASNDLDDIFGDTVDTGAPYRLILFSNNTVKAIPVDTPDPVPPTDLARTIKVASVTLTWTASTTPGSKTYAIYRDDVQIATTTNLSYRDGSVQSGSTYSYAVKTIDGYGQTSAATSPVIAFVNPALNQAPVATVTSWPVLAPTNGKTILRVCGSDVDAQVLTLALVTDEGLLEPTDDPSIWHYTPGV